MLGTVGIDVLKALPQTRFVAIARAKTAEIIVCRISSRMPGDDALLNTAQFFALEKLAGFD